MIEAPTTKMNVEAAIVETYRATTSFEEKINQVLDQILDINTEYRRLCSEWENVNELTESFISRPQRNEELTLILLSIDGLVNVGENLHSKVNKSNIFKLLPSIQEDIKCNLDHIKEIRSDIKIMISDLPKLKAVEANLAELGF